MVQLSAKHSSFVKRILPFAAIALVTAWTYWSDVRHGKPASLMTAAAIAIFLGVIVTLLLRRGLWKLADIVEDHGGEIRVTRWRRTIQLPLRNISRVRLEPGTVGQVVTLELVHPSALGPEIAFFAPSSKKVPTIDHDLQSLVMRVATQSQRSTD